MINLYPPKTKDEIIRDLEKRILALDDKVELLQRDNDILTKRSIIPRRISDENSILKKRLKAIQKIVGNNGDGGLY
jgi:hypothetical protein